MAARRGGGGGSAAGIIALIVVALAYTGNLGSALDAVSGGLSDGFDTALGPPKDRDGGTVPGAKVSKASDTTTVTIPSSVTAPTAEMSKDLLDGLAVTTRMRGSDPTYQRSLYGKAWTDVDGNGCTQRQDVLFTWLDRSKPKDVRRRGGCRNEVYAGTWHDPYTGRSITLTDAKDPKQARLVQIDHVVALSEAHKSGAGSWDAAKRVKFANSLNNLTPVYGPENTTKGDLDPASWRPRKSYQCDYARRWINVKAQWSLTIDASEKKALNQMLGYC